MNNDANRKPLTRVEFSRGSVCKLTDVAQSFGAQRALVLTTGRQKDLGFKVAELLKQNCAGLFGCAAMHTPVDVTESGMDHAESISADCLVSIGGGSTIGLGKAIAFRTGLTHIAVPTTYSGSEATPILGETKDGIKETIRDPSILPDAILYDPDLTDGLPSHVTISSGMNAIAHAAEALYAQDRTPQSTNLAIEGLESMKDGLSAFTRNQHDSDARDKMLFGAWRCGTVLGKVGMALHHKICHTLGGSFNMPHAETHSVMLAHTVAYNAYSVPDLLRPIYDIFGDGPGAGLFSFARRIGAPTSLKALGFDSADIEHAAMISSSNPYWNPREITQEGLRELLQAAFDGVSPRSVTG